MAQISVRLPSGELQPMSYPDDWSEDQVKAAIYKHFPDVAGKSSIPSIRPDQNVPRETIGENESGLLEKGNIDLHNRPVVDNPEGGQSTVYSMSIGTPEGEVLIPRVSDEGKIVSEPEAIDLFHKTGKHLGIFKTPEQATAYAKQLHKDQEREYLTDKQPARPEGFRGLAQETLESLRGLLKAGGQGIGFLSRIPSNIKGIGEEFAANPLGETGHAIGQLGVGLAEGGKGLANLALAPFQDKLAQRLSGGKVGKLQIPEDTGLQEALGLQSNKKGDELIKALPDILSLGYGATGLIKKGYKALGKAPPLSKERQFQNALKEEAIKSKKTHAQTAEELEALKDEQALKYAQEHEGAKIGPLTPTGQTIEALGKEAETKRLTPVAELPEEHFGEIPAPPETKAALKIKKEAAEKARNEVESSLGVLDQPRLKGGKIAQKAIKDLHASASDLYNSARKIYQDKQIKADNSKEIKSVTEDLNALKEADELAPGYGSGTEEQKALESQLEALKGEKVNASDVFDLQRTLEKMAKNARDKQYSGVNELEFKKYRDLSQRFESHAEALANRLESVGGHEVQAMIKEANKGWKTYKDVSRNPVGKAALNKGELPSRAMIDIANTQSGNEFLRALADTYPELKRALLAAHVGESSVTKLTKPTTLTKEYLKALPDVEDKVNTLQHTIAEVKEGQKSGARIERDYKALVKSMENAAKRQEAKQNAIKDIERLTKQAKLHRETSAKLDAKIKQLKSEGKNTAKLEEDLARRKREYLEQGSKLDKLKKNLVKLVGAKLGYEALFKQH